MPTLLLMRHAKSSWDDEHRPDHDRPLNQRGRRDAPRMGRFLAAQGLRPDRILCSSARRARDTAEPVAAALACQAAIEPLDNLYHATIDVWLMVLRELPEDCRCALLIGHNPGLEGLLEHLAGEFRRMPTAAVAQLTLADQRWSELSPGSPTLRIDHLWRPKQIPDV